GSAMNTLSPKWVEILQGDKRLLAQTAYALEFEQRKEIVTTTLDDLVRAYGAPSFVKIDVEGHELSVLRGMRQPVPCLAFEVNLPEFRPEGLECIVLLSNLNCDGRFNYSTGCEHGMALEEWLDADKFSKVLARCNEKSVEVYWKTPAQVLA